MAKSIEEKSPGDPDEYDYDHAERFEQELLRAHALIESTVALHRRTGSPSSLARTHAAPVGESLEALISRARHTMCVTLTGSGEFAKAALRLLPGIPAGVTVRVLCATETVNSLSAPPDPPPGVRLEVRVAEQDLCECLVVDGISTLVRPAEQTTDHTTLVNDRAAVRAVELLFAGAWSRGRRLEDLLQVHKRLRTDLARKILVRLSEGKTDKVAACELGISLRTYRRYVAEFLHEFEVDSRFQAGVRAVELGLLPMSPGPEPGAGKGAVRRGR
ncbi:DNA-binding response regulator [Streptomyces sp. CG1]|uniref:DNA-binding response regulator n=1 Tax=Streptomyces sp. CG1 TaxID=1287523 RepID=UPI0034E24370